MIEPLAACFDDGTLTGGVIHGIGFEKTVHTGALEGVEAAALAVKSLDRAGEAVGIYNSRHGNAGQRRIVGQGNRTTCRLGFRFGCRDFNGLGCGLHWGKRR